MFNGSKIFKLVQAQEDYDTFYNILIPSWIEAGFELECLLGNVERFIIFNDRLQPVGTVGMIKYVPCKSSVIDTIFPFKDNEIIKDSYEKVFEIEYLSIHPEHRKEPNLERILYTIAEYSRLKKMKYGIAIINPLLFHLLKRMYKVPIYQLGEIIERNNLSSNYQVLPVLIDVESVYKNISKYDWLYKIYELDNNLARNALYT
jgi:hypothetical protein